MQRTDRLIEAAMRQNPTGTILVHYHLRLYFDGARFIVCDMQNDPFSLHPLTRTESFTDALQTLLKEASHAC